MATLADIRARYPEYAFMSDQQLADSLYKKYYSDMPRDQFDAKIGITSKETLQQGYDAALKKVRETQFPQMSDAQWKDYSSKFLGPYSLMDFGQAGQLFGFNDEIGAAMSGLGSQVKNWMGDQKAPGFGQAFGDSLALEQARRDLGKNNLGSGASTMELIGGLSGFGPAGGGAPPTAPPSVPPGPPPGVAQSALKAGGAGAVIGGLNGFGQTDGDLGQRMQGAGWGALWGAGTGAAIPVAARGVSWVAGNARNAAAASSAAKQMGVSPPAARFLTDTLEADGALGPAGRANMAAAGKEAMLADAGQSARNALDYAIQSSGRAGARAQAAIDARVTRDAGALQDALDAALGKPQGVQTTRDAIRTGSAAARGDAYDRAYSKPINYASPEGMVLDELLGRLNPSDIEKANTLMRLEGHSSRQIMAKVADDGTITFLKKPDVRQIDYITRALNDVAKANDGLGALGGQTTVGRLYGNLSGDIRDTLKTAVPEYGRALETAADPIRQSQAVQFGSTMLKDGVTREEVANTVIRMTKPERDALAQGIRSNMDDVLANVKRSVMDGDVEARQGIALLKQLSSDASRAKITVAIGKPKADALFAEIDRAAKSFELRAAVATNSKTAMRLNMGQKFADVGNPDTPAASLMMGEPLKAARGTIRAATGYSPNRIAQLKDKTAVEVVDMLTRQGGQGAQTMQTLNTLLGRLNKNSMAAQWIIDLGQSLIGPVAKTAADVQQKVRGQ